MIVSEMRRLEIRGGMFMKNLFSASKQYILYATINSGKKEKNSTFFDEVVKVGCPAYIKIVYSKQGMKIDFKGECSQFDFKDVEEIKLSICGRRASLRQLYFLTLQIILKNDAVLEIETYDYDDGIKLFELAKEEGVKTVDENDVIALIRKYDNDTEGLYCYISSNAKVLFKEHLYDERRVDYLLENKTQYQKCV